VHQESVLQVCVFMSVPGTWSVRLVSDSCIHRLCPLTLNQGTVPHSVPWSGVVCRRGWLVIVWHCNVLRQYPSLFAAVLFIVWLKIVLDCHSLMLREEVSVAHDLPLWRLSTTSDTMHS